MSYKEDRIRQLEDLIPKQAQVLTGINRMAYNHLMVQSRLDELKLEYRERTGREYSSAQNESRNQKPHTIALLFIILTFFVLFLTGINQTSAFDDIGNYRQDTNLKLNLGCSFNNSYCDTSFGCNLTLYSPSSDILINNIAMGNAFFPQYNYTIPASNLSNSGLYYGRQVCCSAVTGCKDYSFQFNVNPQGVKYDTTQGLVYIAMFIILIGLFMFSSYSFVVIEYSNTRGSEGNIVNINYKKYLKLASFMIAYLCFIGIMYFAWNVSYGILRFTELANFFYFLFRTSFIIMFPIFVLIVIIGFVTWLKDKKFQEMIERGLTVT